MRLYGNIKDLKKVSRNSTCNYYRLTLYIKYDGEFLPITAEKGFLFYSKKEMFNILKNEIIKKLYNTYGIKAA